MHATLLYTYKSFTNLIYSFWGQPEPTAQFGYYFQIECDNKGYCHESTTITEATTIMDNSTPATQPSILDLIAHPFHFHQPDTIIK